jgi:hypothetical protein
LIIPYGMTVQQWTDAMTVDLQKFGVVGVLRDPADWRSWARQAIQLRSIRNQNPPDPDFFESWEDWAVRFLQIIPQQG